MSRYFDLLEGYRRALARLQEIEACGLDLISRQEAIAREAEALGVNPIYCADVTSVSYGSLIGVSWRNSWGHVW